MLVRYGSTTEVFGREFPHTMWGLVGFMMREQRLENPNLQCANVHPAQRVTTYRRTPGNMNQQVELKNLRS